ncbi:MAG: ATP-binding protein [Legionellales bacterium]|nr:ATP-binding protein [Legionellales bacterium]
MAFRNLFKRYIPHKESIASNSIIRLFDEYLHDPNIWHIHRRSSAGGAAIGVFCAFIPIPIQTLSAAALAILFRINLPIAILFSFLANPITVPFIFFYSYKLGSILFGLEENQITNIIPENTTIIEWFNTIFLNIWEPLLIGCLILGLISSFITYFLIRLIWRIGAVVKWGNRHKLK